MSTGYYIYEAIPVTELLGGRLEKYGVRDAQSPNATDNSKCLTDGEDNYLWAYGNPVDCFTRYLPNRYPGFILQSIATEFGVEIYSEHEIVDVAKEGEEAPKPSYIPGDKPTSEEIAQLRADWRKECEAFDREMEPLWAQEREATG